MCRINRALNPSMPQLLSFGPSRDAQLALMGDLHDLVQA